jgi:hypothetical protein
LRNKMIKGPFKETKTYKWEVKEQDEAIEPIVMHERVQQIVTNSFEES